MKKTGCLLCWIVAAQTVFAQNYYREDVYTDGYDLKAGDITFEVRSNGLDIILDNVTNELLNKPIVRLDGTPLTLEEYETLEEGELDIPSVQTAFRETFTESEYREPENLFAVSRVRRREAVAVLPPRYSDRLPTPGPV